MSEFARAPLGELMAERGYIRGPFGSALVRRELQKSGMPVYEQQHAITGTREFRFYVSDDKHEELKRFEVQPNDLIISCSGTVGKVSMIAETDPKGIISQALLILRPNPEKIAPRFLRYFLESHEGKHELVQASHGTVQVNIAPRAVVERIPVPVPKLDEQRAIAHILGTLDDKIELNRRMNETLEAIARAMFKSWFVDFDPVSAKASGEAPESICRRLGLTPDLLTLFPDRLVDSEFGEIPEGWEVKPLPAAIDVNPVRTLRKGTIAPYLDMANMSTTSIRALSVVGREFGSGIKFQNGDTLVARITPCLENGKTCFVDFLNDGQVGWGSTEYIVLRPKKPLPDEFAYFLARTDTFRNHAIANMTGTSGRQRVPTTAFDRFPLVIPETRLAAEFGYLARGIITKMRTSDAESASLSAIRDALLPKLLSGELRVPVAGAA